MAALTRLTPVLRVAAPLFREAGGSGVHHAGGNVHIEPQYRQFPQLTRSQVIRGEVFSATRRFWILWRYWHDSDAALGHFPYPDPAQWPDEELGILSDDED